MKTKTAAPKGVKDKALWNKIEENVMKYVKEHPRKYKEPFAIIQSAYVAAGGTFTHESEKKSSAVSELIRIAEKIETKLKNTK